MSTGQTDDTGDGLRVVVSTGLFTACLVAALAVAWWLLSVVDFAYPVWHQVLNIEQTVADNAPLNEYRPGFEASTPADHRYLFSEILAAVNRSGEGLDAITYRPAGEESEQPLLRPAEVIHLRDVAGLVTVLHWAGGIAVLILIGFVILARRRHIQLLATRSILLGTSVVVGLSAVLVVAIGPIKVFYAAHDWIFPADHQWFFYYEESLMTMLMQAPNLFLPMALSWFGLSMGLMIGAWIGIDRYLRSHA